MKMFVTLLTGLFVLAAVGCNAMPTESVPVGNKICPVGGEEVGTMGDIVQYGYKGKIYNLCCKMCMRDFDKDPEKYSKIAEDEVAAGEDAHAGHQH